MTGEIYKLNSKLYMERCRVTKTILKNKEKDGGLTLFD